MATLQVSVDDTLKYNSDTLFNGLGLDTPTAIRIFLTATQEYNGFPFPVNHLPISHALDDSINDARLHRNLYGPYNNADEAVAAMLED